MERESPIRLVRRADTQPAKGGVRQWSDKSEVALFPSSGRDECNDDYYSAAPARPRPGA